MTQEMLVLEVAAVPHIAVDPGYFRSAPSTHA